MAHRRSSSSKKKRSPSKRSRRTTKRSSAKRSKSRRRSPVRRTRTVYVYRSPRKRSSRKKTNFLHQYVKHKIAHNTYKDACWRHDSEYGCGGNPNCEWTGTSCKRRTGGTYEGPRLPDSQKDYSIPSFLYGL